MQYNEEIISNDDKAINDEDLNIRVLDIMDCRYKYDMPSKIWFRPFVYFYFIKEGEGIFFIENDAINVRKGDLLILNSNIGHNISVSDEVSTIRVQGFGVENIGIGKSDEDEKELSYYYIEDYEFQDIGSKLIEKITTEYERACPYNTSMANALATIFIVGLIRNNEQKLEVISDVNLNSQISFIKSYIDKNFKQNIKLDDLSHIAYMNKYNIIAEFKDTYSVTPIDYLILRRIDVAKNLIITTNHPMDQIAEEVGFNSQSYFNQVFKKKVGVTPYQYRKKHRL